MTGDKRMDASSILEIVEAGLEEKPIVGRLVQLYLHDFSELASIGSPYGDVDADGRFTMENFDSYWREKGRCALLFRVDGELAGFALLNPWSPSGRGTDRSIAEYFVMRKYRRAGIGRQAARQILGRYRGIWEINIAHYNAPAQTFWRRAMASVPGYAVELLAGDGQRWDGPIYRLTPAPSSRAAVRD
jgi:predicted acetyltransferase